jgi:uncharacterized protein (TIGR02118 family)
VLRFVTRFRVHALFANELPEWRPTVANGTQRCIATRPLPEQLGRLATPKFAGTLEAWFAARDDALAWAKRVNREYAPSMALTTEEHSLFDRRAAGGGIKGKFLFRRKDGMSPVDFRAYWLERHGPIVLRTPEILAYVQSHMIVDGAAYDGITEIHWPDFAAALRGMNSREMTVEQAGDAANFAAPGSVELMFVSERELGPVR